MVAISVVLWWVVVNKMGAKKKGNYIIKKEQFSCAHILSCVFLFFFKPKLVRIITKEVVAKLLIYTAQ